MTMRWVPCRSGWRGMLLGTCIALAPLAWSHVAVAQPSEQDIAKAREQFGQGVQLEAAGDWAGALTQFESVARVKMTPQVRFHIARCQHKLGNLLAALGAYRLAAHEASSDPNAADVLDEARKGIEEVEAKIPKLVIELGAGAEAASVSIDGVAIGDSSVGKEVPVNPGPHTIQYTLSDGRKDERVVRLKEGESKTVKLTAPTDSSVPDDGKGKGGVDEEGGNSNVVPWVLVGVGGASLVASGVFYMMRAGTISDHDDQCKDSVCPKSLEDTGSSGKTYTTLGNVTLGIGVLGLGVGTVMLLTGDSSGAASAEASSESSARRSPPAPRMTVVFGGNGKGAEANLVGTF